MHYFLLVCLLLSFKPLALCQEQKKKDSVSIKTSAECEMCKERIEKKLAYSKGVKSSNLDIKTGVIKVIYKPAKISAEKIRQTISQSGYDADTVPADPKAYEALPSCCKKGGH